jgi:hypothetical protein
MRLLNSRSRRGGYSVSILELFVVGAVCAISILNWLGEFGLSPDSTSYIAAASSLVRSGRLTTFASYTDGNNVPGVVPYTDQPPGFPLYLAPFILAFHSSVTAAAVAQAVSIGIYFLAIYLTSIRLGLSGLLRVSALALLAFLAPFRSILGHFWTETLFIGVSILASCVCLGTAEDTILRLPQQIKFLSLLAISSTLRFTGVANVFLILPRALARTNLAAAYRLATRWFVGASLELLGVSGTLLLWQAEKLGLAGRLDSRVVLVGEMLGIGCVLLGSTLLLLAGRRHRRGEDHDLGDRERGDVLALSVAVVSAFLPVVVWLLRNFIVYGHFTQTHEFLSAFHGSNLLVPVRYVWDNVFSIRFVPQPLVALAVLGLLILPLLFGSAEIRTAQLSILGAGVAQLVVVWATSLLGTVDPVGDRLLAPALAFLALGVMTGAQLTSEILSRVTSRYVIQALPLVFLLLNRGVSYREILINPGRLNYPREKGLWSELGDITWINSSTHFYSDFDFNHQVFASIPYGIVWDPTFFGDPKRIRRILAGDGRPFILVKADGTESQRLDRQMSIHGVSLSRISFPMQGFNLYYLVEE